MVGKCLQQSYFDKIGLFCRRIWKISDLYFLSQKSVLPISCNQTLIFSGNHECLGGWGREYAKIINRCFYFWNVSCCCYIFGVCLKRPRKTLYIVCFRFENTVVAQFHGHTHNDHFEVCQCMAKNDVTLKNMSAVAFYILYHKFNMHGKYQSMTNWGRGKHGKMKYF